MTNTAEGTPDPAPRRYFGTGLGEIVLGDSKVALKSHDDRSVDLIVTSPPFGLVRKKDYGNVEANRYTDWFKPFAKEFKRVLKENGSLVIDIGALGIRVTRPGTYTISSS